MEPLERRNALKLHVGISPVRKSSRKKVFCVDVGVDRVRIISGGLADFLLTRRLQLEDNWTGSNDSRKLSPPVSLGHKFLSEERRVGGAELMTAGREDLSLLSLPFPIISLTETSSKVKFRWTSRSSLVVLLLQLLLGDFVSGGSPFALSSGVSNGRGSSSMASFDQLDWRLVSVCGLV